MNPLTWTRVWIVGPAIVGIAFGVAFVLQNPVESDRRDSTLVNPVAFRVAMAETGEPNEGDSIESKDSADSEFGRAKLVAARIAKKDFGKPNPLPLPSSTSVPKFEEALFDFLNKRKYATELKWIRDKGMRDTGPYLNGKYYGTHPAVRVYYSPGIISWLVGGRVGTIPDGEMIIKEQYPPPAIRHEGKTEDELFDSLASWTIMIKDSKGSHDGWFWGNPAKGQCVLDNHQYPFDHPLTGFGHYCVRCHASTKSPNATEPGKNNEFTFSALRNIEGFPGEPIIFRVDDSWRPTEAELKEQAEKEEAKRIEDKLKASLEEDAAPSEEGAHPKCTQTAPPTKIPNVLNQRFLDFFNTISEQKKKEILHIPPVTHDWVHNQAGDKKSLMTSNQCMSCHAGLVEPYGPSMFIATGESNGYGAPGWNVSPHGEWRWTPMGLAGRDPVFYSQLESEIEILKKEFDPETADLIARNLVDTCLRCHGAMGKHQFDHDKSDPHAKFTIDHVYQTADEDKEHIGMGPAKYGALARDGISCMVCHTAEPRPQPEDDDRPYLQYFLETSITGNFYLNKDREIYGPFKDEELSPYAMEHGTGIKPKYNEYISSSRMCGSCHTVNLPSVDFPFSGDEEHADQHQQLIDAEVNEVFKKFHHHVEQATYLEWLNSDFENEFNKTNPNAKSCQDCHMSTGLTDDRHGIDIGQIKTRIAAIQDATYPDAENLVEHKELNIRIRDKGYRRHNFVGLNAFLVTLFNQFDEVLGVRKTDFMTGSTIEIDNALRNFDMMAKNETAEMELTTSVSGRTLNAEVVVTNKAGHRFPSGVGFRRAFLELIVEEKMKDGTSREVWTSGKTNEMGMIVGRDGKPLPTEFFDKNKAGNQQYQPHHSVITSANQVQIYETLLTNKKNEFTTSFIHGCNVVKDNRFLPKGWKAEGPDESVLNGEFLRATHPGRVAAKDPRYSDGSGTDSTRYEISLPEGVNPKNVRVRATLYYQSMPPYFLGNLFKNAPNGPATKRLHYMMSNVNLKGTLIEDWKLKIVSAESSFE